MNTLDNIVIFNYFGLFLPARQRLMKPVLMDDQVKNIQNELRQLGNEKTAEHLQRFFKTSKGQYGEGDRFPGIQVPVLRRLSMKYRGISIGNTSLLLKSQFYEERLLSLLLLVDIFNNADKKGQETVYRLYLDNTKFVNNWDIVDCSAEHIVGAYLRGLDKQPIYNLANSGNLWERRISIMSTFHYIKNNEFIEVINVSRILLHDKEDLIQKPIGWMLREIGKRNSKVEEDLLGRCYKSMPRTMLRYAIGKFPNT